ncbi:MAG: hypothetical protein KGH75_02375 [Rhodospirillales bacterium]|nr:hypothetical protein [Rhodospirillales bacterium]
MSGFGPIGFAAFGVIAVSASALALTGSGSGIGSGSGALTLAVALAGSGSGIGSGSGTLTQAVALSGSGSGVGSGSGALRSALALVGVGSGTGYGSGILGTLIQGNATVVHVTPRFGLMSALIQYIEMLPGETLLVDVDMTSICSPGETITSASMSGGSLTFGPPAISVSAQTYPDGNTSGAGQVVQATISGATLPAGRTQFDVVVTPTVRTSFGETLEGAFIVRVLNSAF